MKFLNKTLPILSILIYIISVSQIAFKTGYMGEIRIYYSYEVLLVGGISFLGGGIPETFVWSANFWYLLSLFFTKNKKYKEAIIFSLIATLISISFMLWKEVLWSESGSTASILSLEIGYFLWVISMIILLVNSILLFYKKDS